MKALKTSKNAGKNSKNTLTKFSTRRKYSEAMPSDTLWKNQRNKPKEIRSCKPCARRKTINRDHLFYLALYSSLLIKTLPKIEANPPFFCFLQLNDK
jgi:hypothetical protein